MRNVGIVFSPTLGIPAGVFSLMLGEFKRVFNVDGTLEEEQGDDAPGDGETAAEMSRRNSRHYSDAAADKLLGLSGRTLSGEHLVQLSGDLRSEPNIFALSAEDSQSDEGEDISIPEESGTEDTTEQDSVFDSATSNTVYLLQQGGQTDLLHPSDHDPIGAGSRSHASSVAASRGLNITVSDKASRRQSRVVGLPHSPRPPVNSVSTPSPRAPTTPKSGSSPHSPMPSTPSQNPK